MPVTSSTEEARAVPARDADIHARPRDVVAVLGGLMAAVANGHQVVGRARLRHTRTR